MTEKNSSKKRGAWFGRVLTAGLSLILCGLVYFGTVLLQPEEGALPAKREPVSRLQAGDFTDLSLLEASFGAPLPKWQNAACKGQSRNAQYAGNMVRRADAAYGNGMRVSAVTPSEAAPLIRDEHLTLLWNTDVSVQSIPCALAQNGGYFAAYFTLDQTAYALYMEDTNEESFFNLLSAMQIQ